MFAKLFVIALCAFTLVDTTESLRVLGLFPHPGVSHFHFFHPIMRGLAEAGHDVTVVGHFPDKNPPANYKDLLLSKTETLTNSVDLAVSLSFDGNKFEPTNILPLGCCQRFYFYFFIQ